MLSDLRLDLDSRLGFDLSFDLSLDFFLVFSEEPNRDLDLKLVDPSLRRVALSRDGSTPKISNSSIRLSGSTTATRT